VHNKLSNDHDLHRAPLAAAQQFHRIPLLKKLLLSFAIKETEMKKNRKRKTVRKEKGKEKIIFREKGVAGMATCQK